MAYDEETAVRFRMALGEQNDLSEKRMMGGICFLFQGNMIGGADKPKGGSSRFMFRVGKENQERAAAMPLAEPMGKGGRPMSGFFFVEAADCDDKLLNRWITLALDFVKELPPK